MQASIGEGGGSSRQFFLRRGDNVNKRENRKHKRVSAYDRQATTSSRDEDTQLKGAATS